MVTDADGAWLFDALKNSPIKRDVKISRGTHLMHLETAALPYTVKPSSFSKREINLAGHFQTAKHTRIRFL